MVHPLLKDHEWLSRRYVDAGLSSTQIAEELGVAPGSVHYQLRRAGVKMRGRHSGRWNPKSCETCEEEFTPSGPAARFCSDECRRVALFGRSRECIRCGKTFLPSGTGRNVYQAYCSQGCWYERRSSPPGQRRLTAGGYVMVKVSAGTPGTEGDRLWMKEHRHVVQQAIGRPLEPWETVHHINGVKDDNRLENLQVRQGRHGTGVAMRCLDCGSHNIEATPLATPTITLA